MKIKFDIKNKINNLDNYELLIIFFDKNIINNIKNLNTKNIKKIKKEIEIYNFQKKNNKYLLIKNKINSEPDILVTKIKKENNKIINLTKIIKKIFYLIKNINYKSIIISLNNIEIINNINFIIDITIQKFKKLNYNFNLFKTSINNEKISKIKIFFLLNNIKETKLAKLTIKNSLIISKGIKKSKDLSNMPPNICNPLYIYNKICKEFKDKNIKISCINEKKMKKLGMNAYLSVSKGSKNKPIISIIKYLKDNDSNVKPIIIIGKGLTFDSGGISIKKSSYMHEMKYDMSGASVVYGIMYILSLLKIKLNVIGILSCSENMPDANSTRPGDIVKTLSGKTIEIINTDAEGRLVLCDTLSYVKKYNPEIVIDIATLTNSCVISLGNEITGLMSNNKELKNKLIKASKESNDYIWELPIFKQYKKYLKSNIADITNCSINHPYGGTIISSCFLSYFTKKYKWAHLDIAGTAWDNEGSTGRPINLLIKFLINYYNDKLK